MITIVNFQFLKYVMDTDVNQNLQHCVLIKLNTLNFKMENVDP